MNVFRKAIPIAAVCAALSMGAVPASAGIADTVKDLVKLPGNVQELHRQYMDTKQKLDESIKQAAKSAEALKSAQASIDQTIAENEALRQQSEALKEQSEALKLQSEALRQQNETLERQVNELRRSEQAKRDLNRRFWTIGLTAVGLLAGYFAFGRVLRVALRSK